MINNQINATPMVYSSFTSFLVKADRIMDRTPASIVNNIVDLFIKIVVLNAVKAITGDAWKTNYYFRHIDAKSFGRIVTLIIPGGFICVAIYDIWNHFSAKSLFEKAKKWGHDASNESNEIDKLALRAKSAETYIKAARAGNKNAILYCANESYKGTEKEVFEMIEKLAFEGNTDAQQRLADIFRDGEGVASDDDKAIEWLKRAGETDSETQCMLGDIYFKGDDLVKQDYTQAYDWYKKGAKNGNVDALHSLAYCQMHGYGTKVDEKTAFENFTKAAGKENSKAMFDLGRYYYEKKKDFDKAFEWFDKGAKLKNSNALNARGICYFYGHGVTKDLRKAHENFCEAGITDSKTPEAYYNNGFLFIHGLGVTKDVKKGESLQATALIGLRKSANKHMILTTLA